MAQIVTITNPFTGQPAQVDQLEHTAQEIDDYLNIARLASNPNILDNWYFGNPVNQRGQTSYSGAGYTIDGWINESDKVVATLENGLLNLVFSGVTTYMKKVQLPAGIRVTCSVLVDNISGGVRFLWQDIESYTDTHEMKLSKGMNTLTITTTKQNYRFAIYSNTTDTKTISLAGVGLELGDQQTLAHQENGNWVLNEIPDYGEQLRLCQWYFERIWAKGSNQTIATGIGTSSNIYAHIKIAPKRANPSAQALSNCLGYLRCGTSALDITPTAISLISFSPETGHATLQLSGSFQAGVAYRVGLLSGGFLDFDCSL